jgi:hypothetical protein
MTNVIKYSAVLVILGILLVGFVLYKQHQYQKDINTLLKENGLETEAIVFQEVISMKHKRILRYKFNYQNKVFKGSCFVEAKNKTKIGEPILIRFSPKNPNINTLVK